MGAVALALLIGVGALALHGSSPKMGYLFTDLDPSAAQSISEKLKAQSTPFQLSPDGTAVMAPVDKLAELRMQLASERLGGKIGYAILDDEQPFGVSSSREKLNETRAIEGELARSIESLDNVDHARVHIVMPDRDLFSTQERKATAAVTLKTRSRLPGEAVQAIRYLVASSVPDLSPESISVVDQQGALLARAGDATDAAGSQIEERQASMEGRLRSQIEHLLEPVVGVGKVHAQVAVSLDRDQTREEAETYDPDQQVIAHQVTVESNDQNQQNQANAPGATVSSQLPDSNGAVNGTGQDSQRSAKTDTSEDTSYENGRKHLVSVRNPGKIDRLTVAVMVDTGGKALAPLQSQRLTRLVQNAVGFDAQRGDSVAVEGMTFVPTPEEEAAKSALPFGLTGDRLINLVEVAIIGGLLLLGLRMALTRLRPVDGEGRQPALIDLAAEPVDGESQDELADEDEVTLLDHDISLANVDGRIRASTIKKIGDVIATNPAESTSVIRNWMNA
ncbi:flagellar basal-body MS-ring/collar protein FliF [Sphingomonas sp. RIT328]|uniref:flagellar basal-body MS-ring/collar protein FliF n=1 Tax=Sphingomonas sp. RIT328 TaxID=1470591 RepID=UPI001F1DC44D